MARRGAIDRDRRTLIKWTRGPPDLIKHVLDWASYNGPDVSDVARRGATDQTGDRSTRVDRMRRGPPTINHARGIFKEL